MMLDVLERAQTADEEIDRAAHELDAEGLAEVLDDLAALEAAGPIGHLGRFARARAHYFLARIRLLERSPDRALALADVNRCIAVLEGLVKESPTDADAHGYLGAALGVRVALEGRPAGASCGQRAEAALEKALALDPESLIGHFGMGVLFLLRAHGISNERRKTVVRSISRARARR